MSIKAHMITAAITVLMSVATVHAEDQPGTSSNEPGERCTQLLTADFSQTEDAPTTITAAWQVPASGTSPDTCSVEGTVWRNVRFRVAFPLAHWNGKMVVVGTGGQAGSIITEEGYVMMGGRPLLPQGYAFVGHDAGHSTGGTQWGLNNEVAMIDYGFRGGHVAGVIGKAVLGRFFGHGPARSYYHSCSNGGREAMMMAQRYPWDYDGIVAAAPSMAYANQFAAMYSSGELLKDRSRNGFDATAAEVLHREVLHQCDRLDGVADGILEDPRQCKVDFTPVICKRSPAKNCLTQHQADIARQLYRGPVRADGSQIASSSIMPGSELTWKSITGIGGYATAVFQDLAFNPAPGSRWTPDPSKLGDYIKRMTLMDTLFSATNPDLRRFKERGGKLLNYFGWNDSVGGIGANIDYYETVERLMGGSEKTQEFYRFFMMPGMNHCTNGDGAFVFDYLGELDKWVETGKAPDALTGYHPNPDGSPQFTRSVRPYRTANGGR